MGTQRRGGGTWGAVMLAVAALALFAAAGLALAGPWDMRPFVGFELPHPAGMVAAIAGAGWGAPGL